MVNAAERRRSLHEAVQAVRKSAGLDIALGSVARALVGFDVVRVSILQLLGDGQRIEVTKVWSATRTKLPVGTTMSVKATIFPEVIARNAAVMRSSDPYDSHDQILNDAILREEGVRSWIALPLRDAEDAIDGLFTVASARPKMFGPDDGALFTDLAEAIDEIRSREA